MLRVLIITEDMLSGSVTVRLQNMSQDHFLSPLLGHFLEGVSAVLSVPVEDVFVFNIQPDLEAGGILNVSFSAALPGGHYFPSEALEEQLYLNRPRLTALAQMEVGRREGGEGEGGRDGRMEGGREREDGGTERGKKRWLGGGREGGTEGQRAGRMEGRLRYRGRRKGRRNAT